MITVQHSNTETNDATTNPQISPLAEELVLRTGPDRIFSVFSRVDLFKGRMYGPLPGLVKKFEPSPETTLNDGRDHESVKAKIEIEMLKENDWMQFFKVVEYHEANVHLLCMEGKIYLELTKDVSAEQELLMASYNKLVSSTLESGSRNEFHVVQMDELGDLIKRSDNITEGRLENGDDKTRDECEEGYIDSLHEHERTIHSLAVDNQSESTQVCRRCFGKFTSEDDFSSHSKTCGAFTCIKCKLLFNQQKDFDFHMEKTHWQCPKCFLYFTSFYKLKLHSHFIKFICKTCRLQFSQKEDLFKHHMKSAPCRNCADCGETLGTAEDFFHHVRFHFPSPNYGNGPMVISDSDSDVPPFLDLSSFKVSCSPKQESSYDEGIPNMNLLPSSTQENLNSPSVPYNTSHPNSNQEISYEEIFSHNTSHHNSSEEIPFEEIISNRTLPASPTQENLHSPTVTLPASPTQENLHSPTVPYNTSHPNSSQEISFEENIPDGTSPACPTQTDPHDPTTPQRTSDSNPIQESSDGESNPNRTLPASSTKKNLYKYTDVYTTFHSDHIDTLMKNLPLPANPNNGNLYSYTVPYGTLPHNRIQGRFPGQTVYYGSLPTMPNQSNSYDDPSNSIQENFYGQSAPYGNFAAIPNPANLYGPGVPYYALPYNYFQQGVYGQNVPYCTFPGNQQNLHNPNVPYTTLPYNPYQGCRYLYGQNVPYGVMTATPNQENLYGQNVPFLP